MFEVYNKKTGEVEAVGKTRNAAWKVFYEDVNTFADNLSEFKALMVQRGYSSRKQSNRGN